MTSIVERVEALTIGRIDSVSTYELRISLLRETPQTTALNTGVPTGFPRINAYLLIPNEAGAVVAVVKEVMIVRTKQTSFRKNEEEIVNLPKATRLIIAVPFGTLLWGENDENFQPVYTLERGVPVLPSVGDPVLLPTATQLRSIVEAKPDDRLVQIGTAPFAGNASVWIHPDKLFGRHLAVLGNTGSGKSCSVAGIIRWSLEAIVNRTSSNGKTRSPNARFIVLDPNGEYAEAFKDMTTFVKRYTVGGEGDARPLVVPGWLWNGQEWSAFTSASYGTQRPALLTALRILRNTGSIGIPSKMAKVTTVRRYQGYIRQIEELYEKLPGSVTGFPNSKNFGERLEGLLGMTKTDGTSLKEYGHETTDLLETIESIREPIEKVLGLRHWSSKGKSGYNDFQPEDLSIVLSELRKITKRFQTIETHGEISEDDPVPFNIEMLADCIQNVAMTTGGQAVNNVEPLINRINTMLSDPNLKPVISSDSVNSLTDWLNGLLGPSRDTHKTITILDLSLVPSDVVHIAIAVISRLILEALQHHFKEHDSTLPTVLILEEAHRFVRKDTDIGANEQASDLCRQTFERISREGRKFGLGLVLASQRPSELSSTVLAQCNSFLLHRIVNDIDQNLVRRLVPDALGGLLNELPTLPSQQAILLGWAVPTPIFLRIRHLEQRPRSADPAFWNTWLNQHGEPPDWDSIYAKQ